MARGSLVVSNNSLHQQIDTLLNVIAGSIGLTRAFQSIVLARQEEVQVWLWTNSGRFLTGRGLVTEMVYLPGLSR